MIFICDFCNLEFKGKGYLLRHIEAKHQNFQCNACDKTFKQKRNLLNHLKSHFEKYVCEFCCLQFTHDKLQLHIISVHEPHKKEYLYDCRHCARKFPTAVYRNCHERDVHRNRRINAFRCNICALDFLKKDEMRLHNLENHYKGSIFICAYKECDRYFSTQKLLKIHEKIHEPASYECTDCKKKFFQRSNLSKHKKRCKGLTENKECTREDIQKISEIAREQFKFIGGKTSKNKRRIKYNVEQIKKNCSHDLNPLPLILQKNVKVLQSEALTKTINNSLICDKCAAQFDSLRDFRKHERKCKLDVPNLIETPKLENQETISFKCTEFNCNLTFKNRQNLKQHISQVHMNNRLFQCDQCAKFLKTKYHLKIHLKIHRVPTKCPLCPVILPNIEDHIKRHEKPKKQSFACTKCNKLCSTKQSLNEHFLRIHERRPLGKFYTCSVCLEKFIRNSDLRRHSFQHYDGKVYSCNHPGCPEMFKTSHKLQLHQIIHDKNIERNFTCNSCNKSFLRQSALYKHRKLHLKKKEVVQDI